MQNDNTTPMSAGRYDKEINNTIPYYSEFYDQTLDVIEQCDYKEKEMELLRWGRYQQRHGKKQAEAKAHNARCGVNYFPLTVSEHIQLLKQTGFQHVHVFWYSFMQMGIYGVK